MFLNIVKVAQKRTHSLQRFAHTYLYKMDKAYLRNENDHFQITFQYTNADHKVDRQFNFSRQLSESASTFLTRVNTNVEKALNKKRKKKKAEESELTVVQSELILNDCKVSDDTVCREVFSEGNDVRLRVLDKEYTVIVNSPFINSVALPASILAHFPVYPWKFETVHTDKTASEFKWYKSADKKQWEPAGDGFMFTPDNSLVDHYLKLRCVPQNDKSAGPAIEIVTDVTVSAGPGFCPFQSRHGFTDTKCTNDEFRVVTYNILADLYCDMEYTREVLHPYCPPYALALDYRKQLILKEVIGYNADVICMQEVDRKVYNYDLRPVFGALGYGSNFTSKGGSVAEGVACFYDENRFRLLESDGIILSEAIKLNPIYSAIWDRIVANPKLSERFMERQTAAQITALQSVETGAVLLVANTHLYFHPDADHVRLLQGGMCIKYVEDFYNKMAEKFPDCTISVVFCGDFNSTPECGIFKLFTEGEVGADCIDWESNKEEKVTELHLRQPFQLGSACGTPEFTNYTVGFADCLDYIFYDRSKLEVTQVVPMPSLDELKQHTALPSVVFPSDHVSLVADLKWRK